VFSVCLIYIVDYLWNVPDGRVLIVYGCLCMSARQF